MTTDIPWTILWAKVQCQSPESYLTDSDLDPGSGSSEPMHLFVQVRLLEHGYLMRIYTTPMSKSEWIDSEPWTVIHPGLARDPSQAWDQDLVGDQDQATGYYSIIMTVETLHRKETQEKIFYLPLLDRVDTCHVDHDKCPSIRERYPFHETG